MQRNRYQQINYLEKELKNFISIQNSRIEDVITKIYNEEYKNKRSELISVLDKLTKQRNELDIKEINIYEHKYSKLNKELDDANLKYHEIIFDIFCEYLSGQLKTPKDSVKAFLGNCTYDLEKYLNYFIRNATWDFDDSEVLSYIEEMYNAQVNSYNLNGKVDFSVKTFLMLSNTNDISDVKLCDDEDFYAEVVSNLGFFSKGDMQGMYEKIYESYYDCAPTDFIAYLYAGSEDKILKKSKIVGITIEKFIKNGIGKCYPYGNCIGKVLGKIINKEITNIDRFSILLDTIMERILPMLKSLSEEDLESVLDFDEDYDETIGIESIEIEIKKLKQEFPEICNYSVPNYVDLGNVADNPKK